jgi:hypothetical protein
VTSNESDRRSFLAAGTAFSLGAVLTSATTAQSQPPMVAADH